MKNKRTETELVRFISGSTVYGGLYWYPLNILKSDIPVAAYKIDAIYKDGEIDLIEKVLQACAITCADTFQTDSMEFFENDNIAELLYERDGSGYCFPWYVETFYFDDSKKWMIYVSHEGTITFSGAEIAAAAKRIIPEGYLY